MYYNMLYICISNNNKIYNMKAITISGYKKAEISVKTSQRLVNLYHDYYEIEG